VIIAQVSDIHAAENNDNLARFERALTWIDLITPDALVLTGDLIDDNWRDGYAAIAAQLNKRSYPSFILPGNSDDRAAMKSILHCHYWCNSGENDALHFVADIGELRLIGLDTTIQGNPAGAIGEHLPWLADNLISDGPANSILFMHHPVIRSGIPPLDQIMCRDVVKLAEFLSEHPRKPIAISAGHVHRSMAGQLAGIPAYICGSICPENPLWFGTAIVPPVNNFLSFMIHRYNDGEMVSHPVLL
jgi:3',5'-cyclic-AMP phosphodiesterase